MSLEDEFGVYNLETGAEIDIDVLKGLIKLDENFKVQELFRKFKEEPDTLTLEEIEVLRRIRKKSKKVRLIYREGFYMMAKDYKKIIMNLDADVVGVICKIGFYVNSTGVLRYENNIPIKRYGDIQELLGMSKRTWTRIHKNAIQNKIYKKIRVDKESFIIVNPIYLSNSYEITDLKFIAFHNELKEYLDELDYLYLQKKFELNLEEQVLKYTIQVSGMNITIKPL